MNQELIRLRHERGLTQREVADKTGVRQSMIAMLERGQRRGSDMTKKELADFYGVSVDSLFFAKNITKRDKRNAKSDN